jgi:hypothetical protein
MTWDNVEALFETSDTDEQYNTLCAEAKPADFYFCAIDGKSLLAKRGTFLQIVPKSFFDEHERIPECPLFVDNIVDGAMQVLLGHSVSGYEDNLYVVDHSEKKAIELMKEAGFHESRKLLTYLSECMFDV